MNRNGLNILLTLATALVLSGCGGDGESADGKSAGTAAPANVNVASAASSANVAPANNVTVAPTLLTTNGNTAQPGTAPGGGTSGANNAPPARMPTPQIGSGGNDFYLFTQVRAAINADAELRAASVTLDVKEGVATLSGTVASAAQKSKAERLVREVGLKAVRNQLRVSAGN